MVVPDLTHIDVALRVGLEAELAGVHEHGLQKGLFRAKDSAEESDHLGVIASEVTDVAHTGLGQGAEEPATVTDEVVRQEGL